MNSIEHSELEAAVAIGNFSWLVGREEDQHLEAKGHPPYDLGTPSGRYELAKDVTAFANSDGGWILVGPITERVTTGSADKIISIELISEGEFDTQRIIGIIKTHTYPQIAELRVFWAPDSDNRSKGVGVIFIPQQHADKKPFLITKVTEDAEALKEIVCGVARRVNADNAPYTASELHRYMQIGNSSTAQRLTRIEEKVDQLSAAQEVNLDKVTETPMKKLDERIDRLFRRSE